MNILCFSIKSSRINIILFISNFFFFLDQQGKYSKISLTVDQLLTKLKIKQNQKNCNNNNTNNNNKNNNNNNNNSIPKIQIVDVDHNKSMQTAEGKFEMDYETLIEQATEAQTLLAQLLECNCKYSVTLSWIEIFTY